MKPHFIYLTILALLLSHILWATDYYVSNSSGNDNNSGLNANNAWKNLSMIDNRVFYAGDRIYLKRGDTWQINTTIELKGSGAPNNLIRLEAYGNGNRPHIKGNGEDVIFGLNISNWVIKNLKIELTNPDPINSNTNDHAAPVGIYIRTKHTSPQRNIYIEDNEVFSSSHMTNTGGIRFRADAPNMTYTGTVLENVWFTGNEIHDLGFFGLRSVSTNSGVAGPFKKVQWHNNTVYNIGLQGMVMENVDDGEMRFNLVHHAGLYRGTVQKWGPAGIWPIQSSNILIEDNEVHDMGSFHNTDGTGIDVDWGTKYVTVNDNYVHHNHGPGIVILTSDYTTVTNNRIEYNDQGTTTKRGQIAITGFNGKTNIVNEGVKNAYVANNDIYVYQDNFFAFGTEDRTPVSTWSGNVFENNNIYLCGLNSSAYNVEKERMQRTNNNTIFSSSGNYFRGNEDGSTYNTLSSWRSATGFDNSSSTVVSTICSATFPDTNKWYYIISKENGRYLANITNSNDVQLRAPKNNNVRKWRIQDAGGGYYYVISKANGRYLANNTNDNDARAWTPNTIDTRKWKLQRVETSYNYVISKANGRYLANKTSTNDAQLWTPNTIDTRKWQFIETGESASARIASTTNSTKTAINTDLTEAHQASKINEVWLFPNPASDHLTLRWKSNASATVVLTDTRGSEVWRGSVKSGEPLDVSSLSEGLYLLHLQTAKHTENRKLLIR